jgi:hypothetical protein
MLRAEVSQSVLPDQVVPGEEDKKTKHQHQSDPESDVLDPLSQRTPQHGFASILQKSAPVEDGNGKKVD